MNSRREGEKERVVGEVTDTLFLGGRGKELFLEGS
jgi:hypothetical protein